MLAALHKRLLHPGAATADILHHFVATVRALRVLDATGRLLGAVSEPIKVRQVGEMLGIQGGGWEKLSCKIREKRKKVK